MAIEEPASMSWFGYVVLALAALMVGQTLWVFLTKLQMKGRSVAELGHLFPELKAGKGRAVIYCYSQRCGPCRSLTPQIDRLMETHDNLLKLDIQALPQVARRIGIRATPTTLLIEDGMIHKVILGPDALGAIRIFLREH